MANTFNPHPPEQFWSMNHQTQIDCCQNSSFLWLMIVVHTQLMHLWAGHNTVPVFVLIASYSIFFSAVRSWFLYSFFCLFKILHFCNDDFPRFLFSHMIPVCMSLLCETKRLQCLCSVGWALLLCLHQSFALLLSVLVCSGAPPQGSHHWLTTFTYCFLHLIIITITTYLYFFCIHFFTLTTPSHSSVFTCLIKSVVTWTRLSVFASLRLVLSAYLHHLSLLQLHFFSLSF